MALRRKAITWNVRIVNSNEHKTVRSHIHGDQQTSDCTSVTIPKPHVNFSLVIIHRTIVVKHGTSRHAIYGMLHPTLFPASLHEIDISDMNSYDIVRSSLIATVESDLMNHLHGLSTFWTSNNPETWHGTWVDACQSWQRPRGIQTFINNQPPLPPPPKKQTQNNSQINVLRCKFVSICHGDSVWLSTVFT